MLEHFCGKIFYIEMVIYILQFYHHYNYLSTQFMIILFMILTLGKKNYYLVCTDY